jgi:hypothetical protein
MMFIIVIVVMLMMSGFFDFLPTLLIALTAMLMIPVALVLVVFWLVKAWNRK